MKTLWSILTATTMIATAAVASLGQEAPAPPSAPPAPTASPVSPPRPSGLPPASRPASRPAADFIHGCLEPFDSPDERARFFRAAGSDSELSQEEFLADAKLGGEGFIRRFDRWEAMKRFDADGNGRLTWFEAQRYRQELRKDLMKTFDRDAKGWLSEGERAAANAAVAAGKWPGRGAGASSRPSGRRTMPSEAELVREFDKDGDGKLSDAERAEAMKALGQRWRDEETARWDSSGTGQLNEQDRAAMAEHRRALREAQKAKVEAFFLRQFDADGDGQLDEKETAARKKFEKDMQDVGKTLERAVSGIEGEGPLSDAERKQMRMAWAPRMFKVMAAVAPYMDADGDGVVSAQEREDFGDRMTEKMIAWTEGQMNFHDTGGKGRLNDKERAEYLDHVRQDLADRCKKFSADGSGKLTPEESIEMFKAFADEIGLRPKKAATQPAGG
jgi:Ca2+-binding EF-hand superfamily protein